MILTCPSCGTQYVVKDGAIPPEGRQVRCAACKHSWHQEPEETASPLELEQEAPATEEVTPETGSAETEPEKAESFADAAIIEPRSGPEAEERAYEEAVIEGDADAPTAVSEPAPAAEEAAPAATADWSEPPIVEAAPDDFSPFAEEADAEPRKRNPL